MNGIGRILELMGELGTMSTPTNFYVCKSLAHLHMHWFLGLCIMQNGQPNLIPVATAYGEVSRLNSRWLSLSLMCQFRSILKKIVLNFFKTAWIHFLFQTAGFNNFDHCLHMNQIQLALIHIDSCKSKRLPSMDHHN